MPNTCAHMLERTIQYWTTGLDPLSGKGFYRSGDSMVFVCPHGCEPIVIAIVEERGERELA